VWPASLDAAQYPFRSKTWAAAMSVILDRDGGDLASTRRLGLARFERAVRRQIVSRGGKKPSLRIVRRLSPCSTTRLAYSRTGSARWSGSRSY
jgi:transposase